MLQRLGGRWEKRSCDAVKKLYEGCQNWGWGLRIHRWEKHQKTVGSEKTGSDSGEGLRMRGHGQWRGKDKTVSSINVTKKNFLERISEQ